MALQIQGTLTLLLALPILTPYPRTPTVMAQGQLNCGEHNYRLSTDCDTMSANMETQVAIETKVTYRILPPDEWSRLHEIINTERFPLPLPEYSSAVVAEDGSHIVGVLFLQLVFHMEPLVIMPTHTGRVNFKRMVETFDNELAIAAPGTEYYTFTPDAKTARMAEMVGMHQIPYQVWRKVIGRP